MLTYPAFPGESVEVNGKVPGTTYVATEETSLTIFDKVGERLVTQEGSSS